jgi:hypothetical protein
MLADAVGAPPASLKLLDEASRADHIHLAASDRCSFLAHYQSGGGYRGSRCNQLIRNFKCEPSQARDDPRRGQYKQQAIATLALWLRQAVPRAEAERCTWVPIPPSRRRGDPDFDDRLWRTLHLAFASYDVDVRSLLFQARSTARDHLGHPRLSEQALSDLLQFDPEALRLRPLRERILLFDDLLTSGKHYKCCQRRLTQALPGVPIAGVFLMRRAPQRSARSLGQTW